MGHVIHTTDSDFERDVLKSDLPALVDFWAEWCGPCKMIAPILDEAAVRRAGKLKISKLNVDANPRIPANFNIRSIPTLLLFKNGELVAQKVGALSKSALAAWLDVQLQQSQPA